MHPRRHGATALVLALLLFHSGCGGDGPPAGGEGDRSSGAEGGRSAGGELFSARDAGVTSPPLAHHEILPGEGVTGPDALPPLRPAPDDAEAVFLADLTTHCTQPPPPEGAEGAATHEVIRAAYPGRTTVNTLSNPAPFEGAVLRMVLDDCDGDILPIPFLLDEDRSRTWVLAFEEEGLRLAHDHRDPDGTPGEANLYGGVAAVTPAPEGDERILYFPADARTIEARPARVINTWAMALSADGRRFYYRLYLDGVLRLEAAFDLERRVPLEG